MPTSHTIFWILNIFFGFFKLHLHRYFLYQFVADIRGIDTWFFFDDATLNYGISTHNYVYHTHILVQKP